MTTVLLVAASGAGLFGVSLLVYGLTYQLVTWARERVDDWDRQRLIARHERRLRREGWL